MENVSASSMGPDVFDLTADIIFILLILLKK